MSQRSEKVEKDVNASTANKLLVICIDRDNDVGEKAGIVTFLPLTLLSLTLSPCAVRFALFPPPYKA